MNASRSPRRHGIPAAAMVSLAVMAAVTAFPAPVAAAADPRATLNATQNDGAAPLLLAVYRGDEAGVAGLLKAGADWRLGNAFGATPLGEAARTGNVGILALLLKAGADPRATTGEGQTALHLVARTGNVEAAKLLVKAGADINAREGWGGQTPLMWAASQNQPAMIAFLASKGAEVNAHATVRDWQRRVTAEGRPKDMNHGGFTPLLFAAREGYVDAAKALLKSGADIDRPDPDGTTPLVMALTNGQWDMAKALIEAGANVNDWDFWGQSPLYMAVDMNILPAGFRVELPRMDEAIGLDIIRLLLARGANPDVQLKLRPPYRNAVQDRGADGALVAGATPLMRAAAGGDIPALKLLLAAGAKVDLPNEDGATPLMAAVSASGTRGRNKTEEQAVEAVKLLRAAGAEVNLSDTRGMTAAHSAAFRGWNAMLKELAANGANLDARESDKLTPLDYALGRSRIGFLQNKPPVRTETAALLRQLGAKEENPNLPPWPGVGTPGLESDRTPISNFTRRGFLQVAAATSAGAALAATSLDTAWAREPKATLAVVPLNGGLSLVTGAGGNVVVMGGPEGALLVDGGNAANSAALLKLALKTTGAKQVHTLFNTHWHPDQTGANERVAKTGGRIIAQENTKLWLGRKITTEWLPAGYGPLPKPALPNKSFYTTDSIDFGGDTLKFGYLGQAHTDGDLYVHFTKANVLVAGGVVSNDGWPLLDWQTGGWIGGLVAAYDRLLKVADEKTVVIPANGAPVSRKELQAWREMYFQIFDRCVKQLTKGMGPEECADTQPAKEFEAKFGPSRTFVIASFKSLWGHYAPDA